MSIVKSVQVHRCIFMNLTRHLFLNLDTNDGCAEGVGQAFVFFGFLKEEKTYKSLRIKGTM